MNEQSPIKKIKDNFPDLKFKKFNIVDFGWDKTVVILDNKIVFAFPKGKGIDKKIKAELGILPKLNKKISLPIPNYQYIPKDKSFVGYNFISGTPLSTQYFKKLTPAQKTNIAKQIAVFLSELHSFPLQAVKKCGATEAWSEKDARNYYLKQVETVYKKLSTKDGETLKNIFRKYCNATIKDDFKKALIHQDLTEEHILIDKNTKKVCGIIDFSDSQIADPAIDFSKLWEYDENFVNKVLDNYHSKDKHLKTRSYRWYIYQCIGNMYFGITLKKKNCWQKGYRLIKDNK